jgi:hypothetical protein
MGYLRALQLLTKAYKAAKGRMPEGLDLLKLKQKARQKVIDSKKVIEFPKDRITDPFKPRPTKPEGIIPVTVKGKTTKMSPEGIMNMLMKKGKDVKLGKAPKTKTKDYKKIVELEEENMLADQAKAKEFAEFANRIKGMSSTNRVAERLKDLKGVDLSKLSGVEAQKIASEVIGRKGPFKTISSKGAKEVLGKLESIIKKANVKDFAQGGLANISKTYDNNPTLQSQFPDKQDYLDLFSSTTTTTPQTQTYTQMTQQSPAGIPAVKPIVPIIPQEGGDGGGNPPPGGGIRAGINLDYGYTGPGGEFNLDDIGEGTVADEDYTLGMRASDAYSGIVNSPLVKYNPMNPMFMFNVGKAGAEKARDIAKAIQDKIEEEKAKEVARIARQRLAASMGSDSGPGEGAGTFGASVNEATGARGPGTGFSDYS